MTQPTTFKTFHDFGYARLVPIIPPDAEISENSSLLRRKDARGKAVGVRGRNGRWFGFDWLPHESSEDDLPRWQEMGAGIGIKTGGALIFIDADTMNEDNARAIRDAVELHFGRLPARIGRYPKVGYPIRISEPVRYSRVEFGELNDNNALDSRVEILSEGRQFVAHGVHPVTRELYAWPRELVPFDELPETTPEKLAAFMAELQAVLPAAKPVITEGATTVVNQEALTADVAVVRKAVEAVPNTSATFPTRESYRDFGYAIKAALPNDPDEAFDIFAAWCERWEEGANDPGIVEADWRRMKPPFRRGAPWLFELAEEQAPGKFNRAELWFEEVSASEPIFGAPTDPVILKPFVEIDWIDPATWEGQPIPPRRFVVEGVIPDGEVSLLTGKGGVGKTLLAQLLCTCVAMGLPFLGRVTDRRKVMLVLCEDGADELHNRQADICKSLGITLADLSGHMRIASRKFMDNLLNIWDRNTGAMKRTAVWEAILKDALAFGGKLIVIDTIADTFGGSEIDRSQVRQFVQSCLGKLAQETGGAVLALGHPSRAGETSGEGTSGSTAWHASVRARLFLTYPGKDSSGPFRKLSSMKANYGAAGDEWTLRWSRGTFELVTAKGTGPVGAKLDPSVVQTADAIDDAILAGVRELAGAGKPVAMSGAPNSSYYAPKVLRARMPDLIGLYDLADVEAGWIRAVEAGRVRECTVGRKPNRKPILGFEVADTPPQTESSVFG